MGRIVIRLSAILVVLTSLLATLPTIGAGRQPPQWLVYGRTNPVSDPGPLFFRDTATGAQVKIADDAGLIMDPMPSRDGELAWLSLDQHSAGSVSSLYVLRGKATLLLSGTVYDFWFPGWSDDGRLAWADYDASGQELIRVWDGSTIQTVGSGSYPVWSSDGWLAWTGSQAPHQVQVWDGAQVVSLGAGGSPTWGQDGRLAWKNNSNQVDTVSVWDRHSVTQLASGYYINGPAWSEDGRLAWTTILGSKTKVFVWDGRDIRAIAEESMTAFGLAWSHDGQLAWEASDIDASPPTSVIRVWDGAAITDTLSGRSQFTTKAWSDDGRLVGKSDQTISVWDGKSVTAWTAPPNETFGRPVWWSDGRLAWGGSDIYVWDGQQVTTMMHDPTAHYEYPFWLGAPQAAQP